MLKKFDRAINLFFIFLEMGWAWFKVQLFGRKIALGKPTSYSIGNVRKILLFGYMGMGDAVMFQPTLKAILQRFPAAEIELIVGPHSQSNAILQQTARMEGREFRNTQAIDFKGLSFRERRKLNSEISKQGFDLCVAVYTTPLQYFTPGIVSIPLRAGNTVRAQEWYKPRPNFLLNISHPVIQLVDEREPYRQLRIAYALGIQSQGELPIPHILIPDTNRQWAEKYIIEHGLADKRLIAVHVGVSKAMSWKKWSDEKYAEVLGQLTDADSCFLFFGSTDELSEIERARKSVIPNSLVLTDEPDLLNIGALIEKSALVIGNDSGIGHLSVALGTPTLRIFGMSDHYGCEPFTSGHITLYKDLPCSPCMNLGLIKKGYNLTNCGHRNCLGLITVDEVVAAAQSLLK